ncbi:hypothetical protein PENTCL1PPCAC_6186 [Pristionchus entomophagus]|uniref:c-SKI SMAD4-binding domain-containing protein n=1 Tax=Pristionchus entomophagus TaxID=358040 RepID=A0AAV5SKY5_9BILA|nr:hypothetical protein PENTCL1PPCAC_6186 [Pristionchus entomophagus]
MKDEKKEEEDDDEIPLELLDGSPSGYKEENEEEKDRREEMMLPPTHIQQFEKTQTSGKLPLRYEIKGEKLRIPDERIMEENGENILHHTDLIGFPHSTQFACFIVAGEPLIVLSQMLNELSHGFSHDPMRLAQLIDGLRIRRTNASHDQVNELKKRKIVNEMNLNEQRKSGTSEKNIQLMRKSDASRLLGEYLPLEEDQEENIEISRMSQEMEDEAVTVEHGCQGSAKGRMYTTGYVRCDECKRIFKPDAFCCHSHRRTEIVRVVHWGFNPRRWRDYINLYGKDRRDPEKIKRFNTIISEAIPIEIRTMETKEQHDKKPKKDKKNRNPSTRASFNPGWNKGAPAPFEVGAESVRRKVPERKTDEEEAVDDDEIQIIGEQHATRKDDFLFKAPDLFATPLSRKYTEQALKTKGLEIEGQTPINSKLPPLDPNDLKKKGFDLNALLSNLKKGFDPEGLKSKGFESDELLSNKTKGLDLEGLTPHKLHDQSYQNVLSSLINQPVSVFRAITGNSYHPSSLSHLFPSLAEKESKLLDSPSHQSKQLPPILPPLPATSTAVVPYLKEQHALVTSSASAFSPLHPLSKYHQDLSRGQRREEMSNQLDAELIGILQQIPVSMASRISDIVKSRDDLRDENFTETRNELIASKNLSHQLQAHVKQAAQTTEMLYRVCKNNDFPLPFVPPVTVGAMPPTSYPPILNKFPNLFPLSSPSSLPSSSQPLALLPPTTSVPSLLNGGRSYSMPSPIGIRPAPPSLLGQPPPSSSSISSSPSALRPTQPKIVGQRGRPRGSGGSAYQRKHSMSNGTSAHSAAEIANVQRQIEQQKQLQLQQLQLRQLQHMQQQQQQLQQTYTVPQPSPMGMMTPGSISGSSSSSNLLSFGLGSSSTPVSFSSLLPTSLPSTPHQISTLDYSLRSSPAGAAAIMAKVQLDSSSGSVTCPSSGLATPLAASTPNGLPLTPNGMDNMQSMLHSLAPEELQRLLMQSTILEQQQQLQLQPEPAAPAAQQHPAEQSVPLIDLDLLSSILANPSLIPPGLDIDQVRNWHDQLKAATDQQLKQQT